jgi:hypothetical protein
MSDLDWRKIFDFFPGSWPTKQAVKEVYQRMKLAELDLDQPRRGADRSTDAFRRALHVHVSSDWYFPAGIKKARRPGLATYFTRALQDIDRHNSQTPRSPAWRRSVA